MKAKSKKFNGAVMVFTLLLLFAGTAFANNGKYAQMMLENILENDPVLLGLFLLDVLLIAVRVRKFFRSLIIAFFTACLILVVGPFFLAKTGLVNSTALYVYAGAVFILLCRRKSKKQQQQTDTQDQNQHQEQPSANQQQTEPVIHEQTATTPQQPNKQKKSKKIIFMVLIIVLGTALQGFQKFAKQLEAQRRFEASLPKDEAARKRVEQAKKLIERAENGDDDAQLRLAISLMEMEAKGIGNLNYDYYFPINDTLAQALSFLKKSYKQGNVEAQFLLAFSYFMQGERKEECFKLMKPIAEKDPATIKKVYGITDPDGGKPYSSPEEMVALAQFIIATHYHDGAGTEKNLEQAEYWLKKSLEHGNEFVQEFAHQGLESIRAEKTGKAQTHTTKTQPKTQSQPQLTQSSTLSDAEYKQMLKDPEFAKADKALNNAWQNAQKSLSANAFNVLKQDQQKWISSGSTEWTKGYSAASVTGDKVNVRSKPNTKGKVLFQVSRYIYYERERLIVDSNNPAIDSKGDRWYKVLYRYTYTPDSDAPSYYEKTNGYINGRFIAHEPLTESDYGLIVASTALKVF